MKRIMVLLGLAVCLAPCPGLTQEFAKRGKTLYRAVFAEWPAAKSPQGYAGPEGGSYALEATSNIWMGPGKLIPIATLPGDFVLDVAFEVVYRSDCSLNITLSGAGGDYPQLDFFLDLWQSGSPTFSIYENWVQNNFNVSIRSRFAERLVLGPDFSGVKWESPNLLSVRREGSFVSFSLNGKTVSSFKTPSFSVSQLAVGLSFKSKVLLRSVVARLPP